MGTCLPADHRYYFPPALPQMRDVPREMRAIVGARDQLVVTRARGAPHRNLVPFARPATHWGRGWAVCLPDAGSEFIRLTDALRVRWIIILTHYSPSGVKYVKLWSALDMSNAWTIAYAPLRRRQCIKRLRKREDSLFSVLPKEIVREIAEFIE